MVYAYHRVGSEKKERSPTGLLCLLIDAAAAKSKGIIVVFDWVDAQNGEAEAHSLMMRVPLKPPTHLPPPAQCRWLCAQCGTSHYFSFCS